MARHHKAATSPAIQGMAAEQFSNWRRWMAATGPLARFTASPMGAGPGGPVASLTSDAAGNLYGTTLLDGAYGQGNVFKLTPSGGGWTYTDLYDFTGGSDGGQPISNVTIDANGHLYGTTYQGGTSNVGVAWEITP
jgi:uncharacterized repeat protein (TIGR03803 family)